MKLATNLANFSQRRGPYGHFKPRLSKKLPLNDWKHTSFYIQIGQKSTLVLFVCIKRKSKNFQRHVFYSLKSLERNFLKHKIKRPFNKLITKFRVVLFFFLNKKNLNACCLTNYVHAQFSSTRKMNQ
jgi:hypothetical protein